MNSIGQKIKQIRKERKVSVPKLARLLEIPEDRIYKWESGAAEPKHEDRQKLEGWFNSEIVQEIKAEKVENNQDLKDKIISNLEREVTSRDREITGLKDVIEDLRKRLASSLNELEEFALANNVYLKTVLRCLTEHRSVMEKKKPATVQEEHRIILHEEYQKLTKKDK